MTQQDFVLDDINLDGFQTVRGQYFSRQSEPCISLWDKAIAFNPPAYSLLSNCEAVQIMVNLERRSVLVKPASSRDPDSVSWIKDPKEPKTTRIECSLFTRQLFDTWGWDKSLRYRTNGRPVLVGKQLMLLFDLSAPETWRGQKMVKEDG